MEMNHEIIHSEKLADQQGASDLLSSRRLENNWVAILTPLRIDAFNFQDFKQFVEKELLDLDAQVKGLVFDLHSTQFLSLICIKFISQLASRYKGQKFQIAVASPTEKLKRQIDIYGNLDDLEVIISLDDLI